jgi:hypothetical protein
MYKMNTIVTTVGLSALTSNINVGMDEMVSVFVAKHEKALFDKKEALSVAIKNAKKDLVDLDKAIISSVDPMDFNVSIIVPELEFEVKLNNVVIFWEDRYNPHKKNHYQVTVHVYERISNTRIGSHNKILPIEASSITEHDELKSKLDQLNTDLTEVLTQISSISRMERAVRGCISEMKLKESGFEELLSNPELLQLVELS